MSLVILDQNIITLVNTTVRASVIVEDSTGTAVQPLSVVLRIIDLGGNVISTHNWPVTLPATTRIVNSAVGKFYFTYGNQSPNTETNSKSEVLADWEILLVSGGNITHSVQKIQVLTPLTISYLSELKLLIDKAHKLVDTSNDCYLGYSDAQLISYLNGGLQTISAYQPGLIFNDVDQFPTCFKQLLLDSALVIGVQSQQLFAIDTDIPSYSDQGVTFTFNHQPALASFFSQLSQRLDKLIPMAKLQLIHTGNVHTQMGPNYRLQQLMQSAPSGSLFRNVFLSM